MKIEITLPTIDEVEFVINCMWEEEDPTDHFATGDDEQDKRLVEEILDDYENGNEWAWCCVRVTALWKGFKGHDYLGTCSYKSEKDFKEGGYWEDMRVEAYNDLVTQIEALKN